MTALVAVLHKVRDRFLLAINAAERNDFATVSEELGKAHEELAATLTDLRDENRKAA